MMDNPIINLEKLSEPLTKLVEVISKGIGTLYAPYGTIRQAKADAEASIIAAHAGQKVITIQDRVRSRLEYKGALRQVNIERITSHAALEIPQTVSTKPVDNDWILQFFDHAQDVCDEEMQKLWARILAGEVTAPGSFSKRTLQFLKTLDREEAEGFTKICSLSIQLDDGLLYLVDTNLIRGEMLTQSDQLDFIDHIISIGLLTSEPYEFTPSKTTGMKVQYFSQYFELKGPDVPETKNLGIPHLESSIRLYGFTKMGQELATIAGGTPTEGYVERLAADIKDEYQIIFQPIERSDQF